MMKRYTYNAHMYSLSIFLFNELNISFYFVTRATERENARSTSLLISQQLFLFLSSFPPPSLSLYFSLSVNEHLHVEKNQAK